MIWQYVIFGVACWIVAFSLWGSMSLFDEHYDLVEHELILDELWDDLGNDDDDLAISA